ncbi:phospholipase, partial [Acrasis kona]
ENYIILKSKNHKYLKAHSGIDQQGQWFAEEVVELFNTHKEQINAIPCGAKHKLSVVGHSAGGLVSRYALGVLFDTNTVYAFAKTFQTQFAPRLELISYMSIASPHLGLRREKNQILKTFWAKNSFFFMRFYGHTGPQLRLTDNKDYKKSLLNRMSEPTSCYMQALRMFKYRTSVTIIHFDLNISFTSGSIRSYNPYPTPDWFGSPDYRIRGFSNFDRSYEGHFRRNINYESDADVVVGPPSGKENQIRAGQQLDDANLISTNGILSYGCDLQGTEFDRDSVSKKASYIEDPELEVLKNLQTVEWRRIDIEFRLPFGVSHALVHILPIGCTKHVKTGIMDAVRAGTRSVDAIVTTLELDHAM